MADTDENKEKKKTEAATGGVFNPIQDGPFRGCSQMRGKKPLSLKSVAHTIEP